MTVGNIKYKYIGLTGFAQSGKDETAKILSLIGYKRVSLADPVRKGIYNINPLVIIFPDESNYKELRNEFIDASSGKKNLILNIQDIVNFLGWDEAKKIKEVRRLLQFYGTEGAREIFGENIWTDTADKYIEKNNIDLIVVSDIRFPNELEWIRKKENNILIKIKRPGIGPINSHKSDIGIDDEKCDFIIENNGTLEDLKNKILALNNKY